MSNEQEEVKRSLWKTYGILMGIMIGGPTIFLGGQAIYNSIQSRQDTQSTPILSSSSSPSSVSGASTSGKISQDEALAMVKEWLQAKNTLFGLPYDQQLGLSLTTGKALADNVRGPSTDGDAESSLEWLRNRGKYWKYGDQRIESVQNFLSDEQKAVITVSVFEHRTLYGRAGGVEKDTAKSSTTSYTVERSGGRLKISDFK